MSSGEEPGIYAIHRQHGLRGNPSFVQSLIVQNPQIIPEPNNGDSFASSNVTAARRGAVPALKVRFRRHSLHLLPTQPRNLMHRRRSRRRHAYYRKIASEEEYRLFGLS
nr:hypothetical protein Itr_chr06CG23720 [Ipomoea trifida]